MTKPAIMDHAKPRLTTSQAAAKLGLSRTTVVRWANAGALPCIRTPGGHRRFPLELLEAWEADHVTGPDTASPAEDHHDQNPPTPRRA